MKTHILIRNCTIGIAGVFGLFGMTLFSRLPAQAHIQENCVTQIRTECSLEVKAATFYQADGSGPLEGDFIHASGINDRFAKIAIREACADRFSGTVNPRSGSVFAACKRYVERNPKLLECAQVSKTVCSCGK